MSGIKSNSPMPITTPQRNSGDAFKEPSREHLLSDCGTFTASSKDGETAAGGSSDVSVRSGSKAKPSDGPSKRAAFASGISASDDSVTAGGGTSIIAPEHAPGGDAERLLRKTQRTTVPKPMHAKMITDTNRIRTSSMSTS